MGVLPGTSGSLSQVAWYQLKRGTTHTPSTQAGAVCTPSCSHSSWMRRSFPARERAWPRLLEAAESADRWAA